VAPRCRWYERRHSDGPANGSCDRSGFNLKEHILQISGAKCTARAPQSSRNSEHCRLLRGWVLKGVLRLSSFFYAPVFVASQGPWQVADNHSFTGTSSSAASTIA
jgi:hypothetical protein